MNRATLLASALELAALGLRPVPMVAADKRPALRGWRERASCDARATESIFSDAPHATGLAIATGYGMFVIDLDRNHEGDADGVLSFAGLIAKHGKSEGLTLGPRTRTPRGGAHLYFACDRFACEGSRTIRNRVALAPGVDVKGDGGLAMTPPTLGYRWTPSPFERALPQAPAWLLDLITPAPRPAARRAPARAWSGETSAYAHVALERELRAVANAHAGGRNAALYKAACSLGGLCAGGMLPAEPVASDLFNAAIACGLVGDDGETAARATIASGFRYGLENPRALPGRRP